MEEFAKRLKDLRKEKELSQAELAKALFIDQSSVTKYETCKATPSVEMLIKFAEYFKVSTDYLLGLED